LTFLPCDAFDYQRAHVKKSNTFTPWSSPRKWGALWRFLISWGKSFRSHKEGPMAQNLVRLKTCAEQRNISVVSLRRYISQGKLTAYRLGPKIIMVDLNELDAVVLKRIPTVSGGA
jgi:hypothetical protein